MSLANDALVGAIQRRLLEDGRIAGMSIDVDCSEGYVRLVGVVDRPEQRTLAEELVSGMIGVRRVENHIELRSPQGVPTSQ